MALLHTENHENTKWRVSDDFELRSPVIQKLLHQTKHVTFIVACVLGWVGLALLGLDRVRLSLDR